MKHEWIDLDSFATHEHVSRRAIEQRIARGQIPAPKLRITKGRGQKGTKTQIHVSALSDRAQSNFYGRPYQNPSDENLTPLNANLNAGKEIAVKDDGDPNDPSLWLPAEEAGRLEGKSAKTLKRWCQQGRIRQWEIADDGSYRVHVASLRINAQARWYIEQERPLPPELTTRIGVRLEDLPKAARQSAFTWLNHIEGVKRIATQTGLPISRACESYCTLEKDLKAGTLRAKIRDYERGGIEALAPETHKRGRKTYALEPAAEAWIYKHFWDSPVQDAQLSCKALRAKAAIVGWQIDCGNRTLTRLLDKTPESIKIKYQRGEKAFDDLYLPPTRRNYNFPAMHLWSSDHHQLDVQVYLPDGKIARPWWTGWVDVKSRKVMAWKLTLQPNSADIAYTFYVACKRYGCPRFVFIDNGKDYRSVRLSGSEWKRKKFGVCVTEQEMQYLRGGFQACGVERPVFATAYNAKAKPIERWFRTMELQCNAQMPGYCGRSPYHRPEKLASEIEQGKLLTWETVEETLGRWIEEVYHEAIHAGRGMNKRSPNQCFEQERIEAGYVTEENLRVLFLKAEKRHVRREGIQLFGQMYRNPDIQAQYFDQDVTVRYDPQNLALIHIYTLDKDQLIGDAPIVGEADFFSEDEIKRRKAEHKHYKQVMREYLAYQQALLDDNDLSLADRIGVPNTPPVTQTIADTMGADAKIVRLTPKTKQVVKEMAKSGEAVIKEFPGGATVIDLPKVQAEIQQQTPPHDEDDLLDVFTRPQQRRRVANSDIEIELAELLGF